MKSAQISKLLTILLLLFAFPQAQLRALESSPDVKEVLKQVLDHLKSNEEKLNNYGYFEDALLKELDDEGKVSEQKKRTYRIIWIQGEPYAEMIRFNDMELTPKLRSEEQKRRSKFVEELKKTEKDEDELSWEELFAKYEFRLLKPEGTALYVISFSPKPGKLNERSRVEKIYNKLSGTLWIGPEYSLLRGKAAITKNVKFGLGILGNVQDLEIDYSQQKFKDVWLPDKLQFNYKARIFISTKIREAQIRFYDPYIRNAPAGSK